MSIATEIARLQQAKADLKASINAKGGTITDETIDEYAGFVDNLEVGGGSSEVTMIELTSGNSCIEKVQSLNLIGTYYIMGQIYPMPLTVQLNKTSIEHNHDLIQAIFSQDITSIKSELMSYIQTNTVSIGIPLPSELEGMIISYIGIAGDPNLQPSGVLHIGFRIVMSKENEENKELWIHISKPNIEFYDDLMKNIVIDLSELLEEELEEELELVCFYVDTSMPTTIRFPGTNTIGTYSDYLNLLNNGWTAKIDISTTY